jgi:hypothetical protein
MPSRQKHPISSISVSDLWLLPWVLLIIRFGAKADADVAEVVTVVVPGSRGPASELFGLVVSNFPSERPLLLPYLFPNEHPLIPVVWLGQNLALQNHEVVSYARRLPNPERGTICGQNGLLGVSTCGLDGFTCGHISLQAQALRGGP